MTTKQADTEITRLYERWKELDEQCKRESEATKGMTSEEAEPHEDALRVIDDERIEVERTLAATPAVSIAGVMLKLSIAKYWIEQGAIDPDTLDTDKALALSVYDDLERSLVEAG